MALNFEKKLILLYSFILIGIVMAGIVTFSNSESVRNTDDLVQHTREVLYESEDVLSHAQDIVLGSRGYIITGDPVFLEPFHKSRQSIDETVARLEKLVQDNPEQIHRVNTIKNLIEERIKSSVHTIDLRKNKGFAAAQRWVISGEGKSNMDELRHTIRMIQQVENKLLHERQEANQQSNAAFNRSVYFLLGTILLLLITVFFVTRYNLQERKKVEATLFIKNELYTQTLSSVGDGVIATDINGLITLINKAACEISGWTPEDAIGIHVDRVFDITNASTGLRVINPVTEAMRQNKTMWLDDHTILKRKDGSTFFIDDSGAPIHNQEKEIIGGVLIFRDITEKKKAEEALLTHKNELEDKVNKRTEELRNALDDLMRNDEMLQETGRLAKVGGWEIDLENMIVDWTDEVCRIHELEKGNMPSVENAINYYAPDARPVILEAVNKAIATGEGWDLELPFITAKENNIWVRTIGKTVLKDRKAVRVFGVFQDITERKKADAKLQKAIEQFKYATLASNEIIYDWDINNNTVWLNESYYDLRGIKNENKLLNLESWSKFIHPDDHDRVLKGLKDFIDGRENYWSDEYRFIAKNNVIHHFSDRAYLMRDNEGKAFRMIGAVTDITVWKQNIQHLEEIIFSLSHKVRQPVAHILGIANILDSELTNKEELKKMAGYLKDSSLKLDQYTHELTKLVSEAKNKTENKNWA